MRRASLGLAGLVAALALLVPATGAQALPKTFYGVEYTSPTSTQDFDTMQAAKVGIVRLVFWHSVVSSSCRSPPCWGQYDEIVGDLASRGIPVLPQLANNPADYTPPINEPARSQWIQFAHDAAARYGPNGTFWADNPSIPYKPVTAWQVGNEPSIYKYWATTRQAPDYATFLKITHAAIRGVDPGATIVLAGLPEGRSPRPAQRQPKDCWYSLASARTSLTYQSAWL